VLERRCCSSRLSWQLWAAEETHETHNRPLTLGRARSGGTYDYPQTDTVDPVEHAHSPRHERLPGHMLEGATGETITDAGAYTAPATLGTYHVVATSVADQTKTATATVQVVKSGFTVTGTITKARLGHTATVLSNGKVLVAVAAGVRILGRTHKYLSRLFDPSTGRPPSPGQLPETYATATCWPNGRCCMTGGEYFVGQAVGSSIQL